jgi:hypothetical protein
MVPAAIFVIWSGYVWTRRPAVSSRIQLAGGIGLLIVVSTHVAEGLHVLAFMRWGEPRSPGHYLDLLSADGGLTLALTGVALRTRNDCAFRTDCTAAE